MSYVVCPIRVIVAFGGKTAEKLMSILQILLYFNASEEQQKMRHISQAYFACCVNTILKE